MIRRQYLSFDVAFVETRTEHLHRSLQMSDLPSLFDHVETPEELRMTGGAPVCELTHGLRVYNIRNVSEATFQEIESQRRAGDYEKRVTEAEEDRLMTLYFQLNGDVWTGVEVDGIGPAGDEWGRGGGALGGGW